MLSHSYSNSYKYKAVIFCLFLIIPFYGIFSQVQNSGGLNITKKRDLPICIGATLWTGANYLVQFNSPQRPKTYLSVKIPYIDNFNRTRLNKNLVHVSDATAILTCLAGGATIMMQPRDEWTKKGLVMGQSLWISVNMAHTVKMLVLRRRPYTNAPLFIPSKRDDYYSFYSGHSAAVASVVTSAFLMRNRNGQFVSPASQKILPLSCLALAATTALLRIYSGKHYPSDVLSGITTGIGIAYINYRIHEK